MKFVTGIALNAYLSAEKGLESADINGCSHWYVDASLETEQLNTWTPERIKNLHEQNQFNITPIFHGNFKAPLASEIDEVRESAVNYVFKEIEISKKLNAPLIVHGGAIVEPRLVFQAKRDGLKYYLESLKLISAKAQSMGVELWLENLCNYLDYKPFHYIFTNRAEVEYILSQLDYPKFVLDVGHANVGNKDPFEMFLPFHHRLAAMSFSQNAGAKDDHLPLDRGPMNYHRFVETILKTDWQGIIAFETRGRAASDSYADLLRIYKEVIAKKSNLAVCV